MGTLASIVGLFLGLALAKGLFGLFDAVGFTLPNSGLLFSTRTIIVSLLLGILVTLIASILPGLQGDARAADRRRAGGRVDRPGPVRPLPDADRSVSSRRSGSPACCSGLFGPDLDTTQILLFMILGTVLVFIGVAMLSAPLISGLDGHPRLARRAVSAARPARSPATTPGGTRSARRRPRRR